MTATTIQPPDPEESGWFSPCGFALWLLLGLAFCFPGVLGGWEAFFYRDHGVLAYPSIFHYQASVGEGGFPFWNPLSNCGAPFAAQWGPMVYYPGMLLCLILPLPLALGWFCLAHLWLGGMGMYFLARRWTRGQLSAAVAGWLFVFNGAMFSCLMWPNYTVALGWLPWVVLAMEKAWQEGGRAVLLAGLAAALQLLSGVPELIALTWLAVACLAALALLESPGRRWRLAARFCVPPLLAAGLAAVQLLPFLELLEHSHRTPGFIVSKWTMPVWGMANLIAPLYHCFESHEGVFYQHGQNFFSSYYPGTATVVLAVWALIWARTRRVALLAVLALLCFLLAMGDAGYLYAGLKALFPSLAIVRFPVKWVLLPAFIFPLAAAHAVAAMAKAPASGERVWGVRSLLSLIVMAGLILALVSWAARHPMPYDQPEVTRQNAIMRLLWLGGVLGALALLEYPRARRWAGPAFMLLFLGDILTHAPRQNPTLPQRLADWPAGLFQSGFWPLTQSTPAPVHGQGRIFLRTEAELALLNPRSGNLLERWMERRAAQWSHLNLLDRLPKVNGSSTLQIQAQRAIEDQFYKVHTNEPPAPMLDFLNVTHITAPGETTQFQIRTQALPFITAGQRPVFLPAPAILSNLFRAEFNPRAEVYLPETLRDVVRAEGSPGARIEAPVVSAHRLSFQVTTPAPTMVVIAQSHYPCWQLNISGQPAPLYQANYAFQAFAVPAGTHQIELTYRDRRFQFGLGISLLTLLGMSLVWWRWRFPAGGTPQPHPSQRPA